MHKYLVFIMMTLLFSCDHKQVYDQYQSVPGFWHKDSAVTFTINKIDTAQKYNVFINIRNNPTYAYNNLFLITSMAFPKGKTINDTLEYEMAQPDGTLLGTGYGSLKENKLWYKENVQFPEAGTYTFRIKQAMRKRGKEQGIDSLQGITDIGLRIENIN